MLIKLDRKMKQYINMQKYDYCDALREIKKGKKTGDWIWYIFPQIKGIGVEYMSEQYDIQNIEEAKEYLKIDSLREHLIELCKALLYHTDKNISDIMNEDATKLLSCMTLFNIADEKQKCKGIFKKITDVFYDGKEDELIRK